ncbi:MAG: hypothetical protein RID93_07435, partial [Sandaracinaceae bacterium]
MKRALGLVSFFFLFACEQPPDCEEGWVAGDDGACHCGAADGPICAEADVCVAESAACATPS